MREIKFRAWNKKKKIMCYDNEDDSADYRDGVASSLEIVNGNIEDDSYEFMQYTGLHDKNGKEIYEGDIVKHVGIKDYRVVKFEKGAFTVGEHNGSSTKVTPMLLCSRDEVIGNIYENPELLKE